jgi:hypothetical protein
VKFTHPNLEQAIDGQTGGNAPWRENYRLEERVDAAAQAFYETQVKPDVDAAGLEEAHSAYVTNHVNVRSLRQLPRPFQPGNDLARLKPNGSEYLARIEDLGWVMPGLPGDGWADAADLVRSYKAKEQRCEDFFAYYNKQRQAWPMFAAFVADLDNLNRDWRDRWWEILPRVLGLGHLHASPAKPRPLALMIYPAARVLNASGPGRPENRFAAPTVIDHRLNVCFMPSPFPNAANPVCFGRAVNLAAEGTLVCEIIHRYIPYQFDDVKDMHVVTAAVAAAPISECRQAHAGALRRQPGCADFARAFFP